MKKIVLSLILTLTICTLGFSIWVVKLSLSEDLTYKPRSLIHFVLTDPLLKDLPTAAGAEIINYRYSAADGTKPQLSKVIWHTPQGTSTQQALLNDYLQQNGFAQHSKFIYRKADIELTLEINEMANNIIAVLIQPI
ncbi:hypothetical protein DU002_16830 [Corallincola holothuriorum]|uniref:Uncharacterized protein n=1 Tax=Corallincola holothuriorum TaxID=2282215 RepID=A0A368N6B3_9GAMM|nr:hypothetical protein [Corallincola holothuriorum]RCU45094.1 hypothetical protein DU002_16830 [Corallincola holothuriorum]